MSAATSAPPADNDVTIHDDFFADALRPLWHEPRYRIRRDRTDRGPISRPHLAFISWTEGVVIWCSNDYPGMASIRK